MSETQSVLATNLAAIQDEMARACQSAGRDLREVRLLAVTKYADLEWVKTLVQLGQRELGESRPQQLVQRAELLADGPAVSWHLIGNLQRNKVRSVLPYVDLIHSIDSARLLERVDAIAGELELVPEVLLEVNVSGEESKHGFDPVALDADWDQLMSYQHARIVGLMTMAPKVESPDEARPWFARLRELRDRLQSRIAAPHHLNELSMGMSGDFAAAILEGSTIVRVGSRLFEGLES